MSTTFSLSKAGLEVYTTEPVTDDETEEDAETSTLDAESSSKIIYQNGETTQIDYIGELYSDSFEMDYTNITSSSSVSVPLEYLKHFFKGKKIALKKAWQNGVLNWEHMETAILGFVTEITWNQTKIDVKIEGMDKLLDAEASFEFTQTKRSEVVRQIIEASGLKPEVDVTGLVDDIIDFKTTSSNDDGGTTGGQGEEIDSLVKKIIKGIKDPLKRAKAIHQWLMENVIYASYECSHYSTPEECLANKDHLNCADTARLTCAMMKSAGLNAYVVHGPNHFWTMIEIDGKKYASDQTGREAPSMRGSEFNTVWWQGRGRSTAIPPYDKNGDNPSC